MLQTAHSSQEPVAVRGSACHAKSNTSSSPDAKTCLQVVPSLVTGGVERGTVDVAQALVRAGWRALVVSEGGGLVRELERAGAEHIVLPLDTKNPRAIRRNAESLAALIREQGVDLVHARSRAPAWSAKRRSRAKPARRSSPPFTASTASDRSG